MFGRSLSGIQRDGFGSIPEEEDKDFQRIRERRENVSTNALGNLSDGVGRNQTNSRDDVARVQTLMERNDLLDLEQTEGPTGLFSVGLDNAIRDFQSERDLKQDGLIFPRGETVGALVETADKRRDDDIRLPLPGVGDFQQAQLAEKDGNEAPPPADELKPPAQEPPSDLPPAENPPQDDPNQPPEKPEPPLQNDENKCEEEAVEFANASGAFVIAEQRFE